MRRHVGDVEGAPTVARGHERVAAAAPQFGEHRPLGARVPLARVGRIHHEARCAGALLAVVEGPRDFDAGEGTGPGSRLGDVLPARAHQQERETDHGGGYMCATMS